MQKGKRYRSGLGRAAMMLTLALALSQGRCRAADSWARGMGGVIFPGRDHPAVHDMQGGYMLALVSAANPFSIPGLYESTASLSVVRSGWSAGLGWERTGIRGFSRDRFGISAGPSLPGGFIHVRAGLRADSRSVTGYGRDTALTAVYSLSLEMSSAAVLEMEASDRPGAGPVHVTVRAGGMDAFLLLTIGRDGRRGRIARGGGSVDAGGILSFLAGYDFETGEVSGGLTVRAQVLAAVSWSSHPVLGSTFSVSAGAVR